MRLKPCFIFLSLKPWALFAQKSTSLTRETPNRSLKALQTHKSQLSDLISTTKCSWSPQVLQQHSAWEKPQRKKWDLEQHQTNTELWSVTSLDAIPWQTMLIYPCFFFFNKTYSSQLILHPIPYFLISSYKLRMVFAYKVAISTFITAEFRDIGQWVQCLDWITKTSVLTSKPVLKVLKTKPKTTKETGSVITKLRCLKHGDPREWLAKFQGKLQTKWVAHISL